MTDIVDVQFHLLKRSTVLLKILFNLKLYKTSFFVTKETQTPTSKIYFLFINVSWGSCFVVQYETFYILRHTMFH